MSNFNEVTPLYYWVQKVLPLVYDDSLSYYELLNKVVKKLNDLIKNNADLPAYIQELIESYITSGAIEQVISTVIANFILNVKYPPAGLTPASGNGTTDDTEAIQGCIDYAFNNGGKAVYFPSGSYLTNSLILKDNVSLIGFDEFSTKIVLKGGATSPLLTGTNVNTIIKGLYLDNNAENQVNNLNLCELIVKSCVIDSCIFSTGIELLNITVNNDAQLTNLAFNNAGKKAMILNGSGKIISSSLIFNDLSPVLGESFIEINSNNSVIEQAILKGVATKGIVINGNSNIVKFWCETTTSYEDNGSFNNVEVYTKSKAEKFSNFLSQSGITFNQSFTNKTTTFITDVENVTTKTVNATDITETLTNNYNLTAKDITQTAEDNLNITANSILTGADNKTDNISQTARINSTDFILNTTNPVTYKSPFGANDFYKKIPFKDFSGNNYNVMVDGDNNVLPQLRNHNITELPDTEIHGLHADLLFSRDGDSTNFKSTEEPTYRSQAFIDINRTPSTPWVVQEAIQTVIGSNANEKIASSFKEMFSYHPGHLEHITSVNVNNAMAEPDGVLDNGMLWAQWNIVKNNGFNSNGIAQEVNVRNTKDNWYDVADPLTSVPQHFMYCEQIYPDWSTKHSTRGISIQSGSAALGEPIGFSTGLLVSGFVDRGVYIDTNIAYRDPVTHLDPSNPIGLVFGSNLQNLIVVKDSPTTNGWFINKESDYLLFRKDGSNWFMAMDKTTDDVYFCNKMFSVKKTGRMVIGANQEPSGITGYGLTISEDAKHPLTLKVSTGAGGGAGAGYGTLRFQAGTTPGTLMLCAYSGTSDVGVVIADNIGGGN